MIQKFNKAAYSHQQTAKINEIITELENADKYSPMSAAEATAGTSTMARVISAKTLSDYVAQRLATISQFAITIVNQLPSTGDPTTVYLVRHAGETSNLYAEYVYVNNAWEKLGDKTIDLSNYLQYTDIVTGTTNGTIKVAGTDVAVKGLQSTAYRAENYFAANSHQHAASDINAMTGYNKLPAGSAITTSDSLNVAIGKLEAALDSKQAAGNYLTTVSWNVITNKPTTYNPASHTHATNEINALTGYSKPTASSAISANDTLNTALGKLERALDTKQNSGDFLTTVSWDAVTNKPSTFAPSAHNQASNTINAMTGYAKPSSTSAIVTSDTLNGAIGKLERALDNKQPTGNYLTAVSWDIITGKPSVYTPDTHNQASSTINLMTGYSKPNSTSAIAASDTLNAAIGKLERALDNKQASGNYANANHSHTEYVPTSRTVNNKALTTNITLSYSDVGAAAAQHDQASNTITALTGYSKPSATSAIAATDALNTALGKLEKALDNKLSSSDIAAKATADAAGNNIQTTYATKAELNAAQIDTSAVDLSGYAPVSHTQASNTINAMTGYSKPNSTSAITVSDTLNAAIGKLEKAIEEVGNTVASSSIDNSTTIGTGSTTSGTSTVAIGTDSATTGDNTVAVGNNSVVNGNNSMAIGDNAEVSGQNSIGVGQNTSTEGENVVAIGFNTTADASGATATGGNSTASGENSSAYGSNANVTGDNAIGIGSGTSVTSSESVGIGTETTVTGTNSVAIGNEATVTGQGSTAIGTNTAVSSSDSVAIGKDSSASDNNVVSVGHSAGDKDGNNNTYTTTLTRRIVNVADGVNATDAATVGQLQAIRQVPAGGSNGQILRWASSGTAVWGADNDTKVGSDITLTGYSKPSSTSAVAATDTVNAAIGKLEKALDEKQASGSYAPLAHNQASDTINAMTGYSKALSVSAISSSDSLNTAIGKLEKGLDGLSSKVDQSSVGNEAGKIPRYSAEGHLILPSGIELF